MKEGLVKFFNDKNGFGFITADGDDYFVHFRSIVGQGFKTLKEGDRVKFEPGTGPKGLVADNVSVIRD